MLAQQFRFHGYGSLRFLYQKGRTFRSGSLALRMVRNARRSDSRCAIVVTKKVQKAAPHRNRIRRRLYEIIRTNWSHIKPGHDMVITIYDPDVVSMPHSELEKTVIGVLKQANIWQTTENHGENV